MRKKTIFILLLVLLMLLIGCDKKAPIKPSTTAANAADVPSDESVPKEESTPKIVFTAQDAQGNTVSGADWADYNLIMLNFWATWCPPCLAELPDLQKLQEDHAERGLLLVGVLVDGTAEDALPYIGEHGLSYPIIAAAGDLKLLSSKMQYVPTTVFVTPSGLELREEVGSRSYADWAEIVEELLP